MSNCAFFDCFLTTGLGTDPSGSRGREKKALGTEMRMKSQTRRRVRRDLEALVLDELLHAVHDPHLPVLVHEPDLTHRCGVRKHGAGDVRDSVSTSNCV